MHHKSPPDPYDYSREFENARRDGRLIPSVKNAEQFTERLEAGRHEAFDYLTNEMGDLVLNPSLDQLSDIHRMLFGRVYRDAGDLRETSVEIVGHEAPAPEHIGAAMGDLHRAVARELAHAHSPSMQCRITATLHCGIVATQPFAAGNGLTARLVSEAQLHYTLGDRERGILNAEAYGGALAESLATQDPAALENCYLRREQPLSLETQKPARSFAL